MLKLNPEMKQMKQKETPTIQVMLTSIELVKEIFTSMFREQDEKLLNIVRKDLSGTKAHLDLLTQERIDDNIKLNALSKETDDLKLSLETSQEIAGNKLKEINHMLKIDKQHGKMKLMSCDRKMNISVKS